MKKNRDQMIAALKQQFPQGNFVDASEFYGKPKSGIWIKGDFDIDGVPAFSCYGPYDFYIDNVHPKLHAVLTEHGWFAEPHDAGTIMLWD